MASPDRKSAVPLLALALVLLLIGCAGGGPDAPLSPLDIRARLSGHLVEATRSDGRRHLIRFGRAGTAEVIGESSEFARWSADPERGLCLRPHDAPLGCAPLYQLNVAHFRWGDTMLSDLTVPAPGLGRGWGGMRGLFR